MKKTIIVSAFPGTGKTYFWVNTDLEVVDSDFSKFDKKDFPQNYINHIKSLIGVKDIILISSHDKVCDVLRQETIPYILVYPSRECKEEYLERYRNRNNDPKFIDLMDKRWDDFIASCYERSGCSHIVLAPGQYLSDIIPKDFIDKMYPVESTEKIEVDVVIPSKDDKAKYRRELKSALKEILVHDFGITREWVRDQTTNYIREIVDIKTKSVIEGLTADKINIVSKQIIHDHLVNEGVIRITRDMRHEVSNIGEEVRKKMRKNFNIEE